jgi:hypothetical protein
LELHVIRRSMKIKGNKRQPQMAQAQPLLLLRLVRP